MSDQTDRQDLTTDDGADSTPPNTAGSVTSPVAANREGQLLRPRPMGIQTNLTAVDYWGADITVDEEHYVAVPRWFVRLVDEGLINSQGFRYGVVIFWQADYKTGLPMGSRLTDHAPRDEDDKSKTVPRRWATYVEVAEWFGLCVRWARTGAHQFQELCMSKDPEAGMFKLTFPGSEDCPNTWGGYIHVPRNVALDPRITSQRLAWVCRFLMVCPGPYGMERWPKLKTIATKHGVSERTVMRAYDDLEAAGLALPTVRWQGSRRLPCVYKFATLIPAVKLEATYLGVDKSVTSKPAGADKSVTTAGQDRHHEADENVTALTNRDVPNRDPYLSEIKEEIEGSAPRVAAAPLGHAAHFSSSKESSSKEETLPVAGQVGGKAVAGAEEEAGNEGTVVALVGARTSVGAARGTVVEQRGGGGIAGGERGTRRGERSVPTETADVLKRIADHTRVTEPTLGPYGTGRPLPPVAPAPLPSPHYRLPFTWPAPRQGLPATQLKTAIETWLDPANRIHFLLLLGTEDTTLNGAWQAVQAARKAGHTYETLDVQDLLASMRPGGESGAYKRYCDMPGVLVVTDMGTENVSDWVRQQWHGIVDARYTWERLMLIASPLTPDQFWTQYAIRGAKSGNGQFLGGAIVDRLFAVDDAVIVNMADLSVSQEAA